LALGKLRLVMLIVGRSSVRDVVVSKGLILFCIRLYQTRCKFYKWLWLLSLYFGMDNGCWCMVPWLLFGFGVVLLAVVVLWRTNVRVVIVLEGLYVFWLKFVVEGWCYRCSLDSCCCSGFCLFGAWRFVGCIGLQVWVNFSGLLVYGAEQLLLSSWVFVVWLFVKLFGCGW